MIRLGRRSSIMVNMCTRYVAVLLLVVTKSSVSVSSQARTTNKLTTFDEILGNIRTDKWIDLSVTGNGENVSACINDVTMVWKSAAAGNKWALHMLDAESKIQSGILLGNFRYLGIYDQCVKIAAQHNPTNVQSQYCMVSFSIPPEMFSDAPSLLSLNKLSVLGQFADSALSFTSAMCLPSSCSENDISIIVNEIIKQKTELDASKHEVAHVTCSRPKDGRFTVGKYLITVFIAMIISFLLCCTVCEFVNRRNGRGSFPVVKTLAKFSLYTNAANTLSTEMTPDTIPTLNGIRVLSAMFVIIIHRFTNTIMSPVINLSNLLEWQYTWEATFLYMAPFVIDNFFIMGGFLVTYNLLQSTRSGKKFNLLENCISRYVRLTPSAAAVILITIFYFQNLGSGPVWDVSTNFLVDYCRRNWWTNFLHLQTILNTENMCLPHLWYLGVEMQLFFITQFILFALFRWTKYRKSIVGLVILCSLVIPPVPFAINGYTNAIIKITPEISIPDFKDNLIYGYMSTIQWSFPYSAGAILGYITVNKKIKITKFQAKIYWAMACSLMISCFLATHYLYLESYEYDTVFEVAYAALARPAWTLAIVWIIFACTHGYGGLLAAFLSASVFLPLSRISYCAYLVHFMLQLFMTAGVQVPIFYSEFEILHQVWGDLLVSGVLGFLLSLFIETPIRILDKTYKNSITCQALSAEKSSEIILKKNADRKAKKIK